MHPAPPVPAVRPWRPWRVALITVVATLAVAVPAAIVWVWSDPYRGAEDAASEFGVQMNTYDARRPREFLDRTAPYLDAAYRDEFAALVTPLLADLARAEQTSDRASVDGVSEVAISEDEARLELDVSSRISQRDQVLPERLAQTWTLDLIERDGRWFVTAFEFTAGEPDGPTTET